MATIKTRTRTDGTRSFQVPWRLGGSRDGGWQAETFGTRRDARAFALDVEAAGHDWPADWGPGVRYMRSTTAPSAPGGTTPRRAFARGYVEELTDIGPDTRQRYLHQVDRLADELAVVLGRPATGELITDAHARRWITARRNAGAKPKTVANYHGLLAAVFKSAVKTGLRPDNPCADTRLPRRDVGVEADDTKVFLTEAQFSMLLTHLAADIRDLADLAVCT